MPPPGSITVSQEPLPLHACGISNGSWGQSCSTGPAPACPAPACPLPACPLPPCPLPASPAAPLGGLPVSPASELPGSEPPEPDRPASEFASKRETGGGRSSSPHAAMPTSPTAIIATPQTSLDPPMSPTIAHTSGPVASAADSAPVPRPP